MMFLLTNKKILSAICAFLLIFSFTLSAAAFEMNDFDPNDENATVRHGSNEEYTDICGDPIPPEYIGETVYDEENDVYKVFDPSSGGYTDITQKSDGEGKEMIREPLFEELCIPLEETVKVEEDFGTQVDADKIEEALAYFYKLSGVQPYLILRSGTDKTVNDAAEKYKEIFADEGHLLFIFTEYGSYVDYSIYYFAGSDAREIADYEVCEKISAYIRECSDNGFTYEETFVRSFERGAEFAMYGTESDIVSDEAGIKHEEWEPEYWTGTTEIIGGSDKKTFISTGFGATVITILAIVFAFSLFIIIFTAVKKNSSEKRNAPQTAAANNTPAKQEKAAPSDTDRKDTDEADSSVQDSVYAAPSRRAGNNAARPGLPERCARCGFDTSVTINGRCRNCGHRIK